MQRALERSGLAKLVSAHPKGLDLPIYEGGRGLSGGQRQLVAFTRLLLSTPEVFLLDEPTASMDEEQERRCLSVLAEEIADFKTLVIVSHKASVLTLVDRLIIVAGNQIMLDGPREAVLAHLNKVAMAAAAPNAAPNATPLIARQLAEIRPHQYTAKA